jgi:hypothetical protein
LFLKTPKASFRRSAPSNSRHQVAEILVRVRGIVSSVSAVRSASFDAPLCHWRAGWRVAVILPSLLETLREVAPGVDVGIRQLLPVQGFTAPHLAWKDALKELEDRRWISRSFPSTIFRSVSTNRSSTRKSSSSPLRKGHSFQRNPTLKRYCEMEHLVVSHTGDVSGFVDVRTREKGLTRRVALTVPNFIFALSVLAETEMVSALPNGFVEIHGARFDVVAVKAPLPLPRFSINICLPKVAMMDAGLAWLVLLLGQRAGQETSDRSVLRSASAIAACTANEQLLACGAFGEGEPRSASAK